MKQLRLWRIRRAYRLIEKLEPKIGDEALELRGDFTRDTFEKIDNASRKAGLPRGDRRRRRRKLMSTSL